jgi:surface protein
MSDLLLMGGGRGSYGESFVYAGNLEYTIIERDGSLNNYDLKLDPEGTYDFTIDWGDGSSDVITSYNQPETTHAYSTLGPYTVSVSGRIDNTQFLEVDKAASLPDWSISNINSWGNFKIDTSGTFVRSYFSQGVSFPPYSPLNEFLRLTFAQSQTTTNTTIDLNSWDTSSATSLEGIFSSAYFGNLLINNWDTSAVTNMEGAFSFSSSANLLNISNWDVSNVTNFKNTFSYTYNSFSVSDITGWDTSSATDMSSMFKQAHSFNQNISTWNVSNVQSFEAMFSENLGFNQPIGSWDMSSATTIAGMFFPGSVFNQPIGSWNTSNVQSFAGVFGNFLTNTKTPFNQDISNWDFTGCLDNTSMQWIFGLGVAGYTAFCSMSQANYEALLISWASQAANMPTGMLNIDSDFVYGAGSAAETARNTLVNTYGWNILDGGAV